MRRPRALAIAIVLLASTITACTDDGVPPSGSYCVAAPAKRCATISFPTQRGTASPGTMQLDDRRYELTWMDGEGKARRYVANPPSGTVAFEMSAGAGRTLILKWRDRRPDETFALEAVAR